MKEVNDFDYIDYFELIHCNDDYFKKKSSEFSNCAELIQKINKYLSENYTSYSTEDIPKFLDLRRRVITFLKIRDTNPLLNTITQTCLKLLKFDIPTESQPRIIDLFEKEIISKREVYFQILNLIPIKQRTLELLDDIKTVSHRGIYESNIKDIPGFDRANVIRHTSKLIKRSLTNVVNTLEALANVLQIQREQVVELTQKIVDRGIKLNPSEIIKIVTRYSYLDRADTIERGLAFLRENDPDYMLNNIFTFIYNIPKDQRDVAPISSYLNYFRKFESDSIQIKIYCGKIYYEFRTTPKASRLDFIKDIEVFLPEANDLKALTKTIFVVKHFSKEHRTKDNIREIYLLLRKFQVNFENVKFVRFLSSEEIMKLISLTSKMELDMTFDVFEMMKIINSFPEERREERSKQLARLIRIDKNYVSRETSFISLLAKTSIEHIDLFSDYFEQHRDYLTDSLSPVYFLTLLSTIPTQDISASLMDKLWYVLNRFKVIRSLNLESAKEAMIDIPDSKRAKVLQWLNHPSFCATLSKDDPIQGQKHIYLIALFGIIDDELISDFSQSNMNIKYFFETNTDDFSEVFSCCKGSSITNSDKLAPGISLLPRGERHRLYTLAEPYLKEIQSISSFKKPADYMNDFLEVVSALPSSCQNKSYLDICFETLKECQNTFKMKYFPDLIESIPEDDLTIDVMKTIAGFNVSVVNDHLGALMVSTIEQMTPEDRIRNIKLYLDIRTIKDNPPSIECYNKIIQLESSEKSSIIPEVIRLMRLMNCTYDSFSDFFKELKALPSQNDRKNAVDTYLELIEKYRWLTFDAEKLLVPLYIMPTSSRLKLLDCVDKLDVSEFYNVMCRPRIEMVLGLLKVPESQIAITALNCKRLNSKLRNSQGGLPYLHKFIPIAQNLRPEISELLKSEPGLYSDFKVFEVVIRVLQTFYDSAKTMSLPSRLYEVLTCESGEDVVNILTHICKTNDIQLLDELLTYSISKKSKISIFYQIICGQYTKALCTQLATTPIKLAEQFDVNDHYNQNLFFSIISIIPAEDLTEDYLDQIRRYISGVKIDDISLINSLTYESTRSTLLNVTPSERLDILIEIIRIDPNYETFLDLIRDLNSVCRSERKHVVDQVLIYNKNEISRDDIDLMNCYTRSERETVARTICELKSEQSFSEFIKLKNHLVDKIQKCVSSKRLKFFEQYLEAIKVFKDRFDLNRHLQDIFVQLPEKDRTVELIDLLYLISNEVNVKYILSIPPENIADLLKEALDFCCEDRGSDYNHIIDVIKKVGLSRWRVALARGNDLIQDVNIKLNQANIVNTIANISDELWDHFVQKIVPIARNYKSADCRLKILQLFKSVSPDRWDKLLQQAYLFMETTNDEEKHVQTIELLIKAVNGFSTDGIHDLDDLKVSSLLPAACRTPHNKKLLNELIDEFSDNVIIPAIYGVDPNERAEIICLIHKYLLYLSNANTSIFKTLIQNIIHTPKGDREDVLKKTKMFMKNYSPSCSNWSWILYTIRHIRREDRENVLHYAQKTGIKFANFKQGSELIFAIARTEPNERESIIRIAIELLGSAHEGMGSVIDELITVPSEDRRALVDVANSIKNYKPNASLLKILKKVDPSNRQEFVEKLRNFHRIHYLNERNYSSDKYIDVLASFANIDLASLDSIIEMAKPLNNNQTIGYNYSLKSIVEALAEVPQGDRPAIIRCAQQFRNDILSDTIFASLMKEIVKIPDAERDEVFALTKSLFPKVLENNEKVLILKNIAALKPSVRKTIVNAVDNHLERAVELSSVIKGLGSVNNSDYGEILKLALPFINDLTSGSHITSLISSISFYPAENRKTMCEKVLAASLDNRNSHKIISEVIHAGLYISPLSYDLFLSKIFALNFNDKSMEWTEILEYVFQESTIRGESYRYLEDTLLNIGDEIIGSQMAKEIIAKQEIFLLSDDSVILDLAVERATISDRVDQTSLHNPYFVYRRLRIESQNPLPQMSSPRMIVEGYVTILNLQKIKDMKLSRKLTVKDLPNGVDKELLRSIFNKFEARLEKLKEYEFNCVRQAIVNFTGENLGYIKNTFLDGPYLNSLFNIRSEAKSDDDVLPSDLVQFFWIIKHVSEKSDEIPKGEMFTEQELGILNMANLIKNCNAGIVDGIVIGYSQLPDGYKPSNITEDSPSRIRVENTVKASLQKTLYHNINTNEPMLIEMTGETGRIINQASHQCLYIKNFIGSLVGLTHTVKFDLHSHTLYSQLLEKSQADILSILWKHVTPKVLVEALKEYVNNALSGSKTLYKDISALVEAQCPLKNVWDIDEEDRVSLTTVGAITLLRELKYFTC